MCCSGNVSISLSHMVSPHSMYAWVRRGSTILRSMHTVKSDSIHFVKMHTVKPDSIYLFAPCEKVLRDWYRRNKSNDSHGKT